MHFVTAISDQWKMLSDHFESKLSYFTATVNKPSCDVSLDNGELQSSMLSSPLTNETSKIGLFKLAVR